MSLPTAATTLVTTLLALAAFSVGAYDGGPITQQAEGFGIKRCLPEVLAVDQFLNESGGPNGASSWAATQHPDRRLYSAMNVKKYNDGTWGFDIVTVAPGVESCDGTLTRVVTFPGDSCSKVRETIYKDYTFNGDLAGKAIYRKGSTDLALEDLGGGCVAVRMETLLPVPK